LKVEKCRQSGCDAEKSTTIEAYGQHTLYVDSVELAPGADTCKEGVLLHKKCQGNGNECDYTETETVTGEHISLDKYAFDEGSGQPYEEEKLMLGSYLTAAGISYSEEPSIVLVAGCICGEQKASIYMNGGMDMYSNTLFTGFEGGFHATTPYEQTLIAIAQPMPTMGPGMPGYVDPTPYKICFESKLSEVDCRTTYSVTVKIGYDEDTGTAVETKAYTLNEYDSHTEKTTATVADPTKSCYQNCRDENGAFFYGINVTKSCADCGEILDTYTDAVTSSSSHYFTSKEVFEHKHDATDSYYGVRVFIRECPCGQVEYTLHRGDCSFERSTVGDATVYACSCGFIYAERRNVTVTDTVHCRQTKTDYLYLGCSSVNAYTDCDKTVVCPWYDEVYHDYSLLVNETNKDDPEPTDDPCRYYVYDITYCDKCNWRTYSSYEGYRTIHDLNKTSGTPDSHGNVTTTETCMEDGCGYLSIVLKDKDGNMLRSYTEEKDYERNELCFCLSVWKMIGDEPRLTLERNEYYDLETEELKRWNQTLYTYTIDAETGCIQKSVFTDHEGEYSEYESNFCNFDDEETQMKTCLQDGYYKRICSTCTREEYGYYEECMGHSLETRWGTYSNGSSYEYYWCGYCSVYSKYNTYGPAAVDVMPMGEEEGTVKLDYVKRQSSASVACTFEVYRFDHYGYLSVNEEDGTPVKSTLSGIIVSDDGIGTLSFAQADVAMALDALTLDTENYSYQAYLVITCSDGNVTYVPVSQ